jgi:hypothetical protein
MNERAHWSTSDVAQILDEILAEHPEYANRPITAGPMSVAPTGLSREKLKESLLMLLGIPDDPGELR